MKLDVRKITITGVLLAFGIIIPRIFHMIGNPILGQMFLPMHLGVFIGGLFLGKYYGLILGFATPLLSFFISGMPPIPISSVMAFELAAYGFFAGFFMSNSVIPRLKIFGKNVKIYISLLLSMIIGRIVYGVALLVTAQIFVGPGPKPAPIVTATYMGIPGILLQLIMVPVIVFALKKALKEV